MEKKRKRILVIGAGFGGLASAALLADAGFDVTVLEKNDGPGGRASVLRGKGFQFDRGPSWYLMPDIFEAFFQKLGVNVNDLFKLVRLDPQYKIFFSAKESVSIRRDMKKNIALFETLEPGSGKSFRKYLAESQLQYEMAVSEFLYKDYTSIFDFVNRKVLVAGRKIRVFQSMKQYLDSLFVSEKIKKILLYAVVFLGGSPENTPALYSLLAHIDFNLGVWYPMGGIFAVVKALEKVGKKKGVKFKYSSPVSKIEVNEAGFATGVYVGKKFFPADVVIANAEYPFVETQLLAPQFQTYPAQYWQKKTLAPSALLMYLGINKKIKKLSHHSLYFGENWEQHFDAIFKKVAWPEDPSYYISCPSKTDTSVAPEGCENVVVLVPLSPYAKDNSAVRTRYVEKVITHLEEIVGENIHDHIIFREVFSQSDFEKRYHAYKGTALGLAHTLFQTALFRPKNVSKKVKNLLYVGQYTIPGIGMPMCLISAEIVSQKILKKFS